MTMALVVTMLPVAQAILAKALMARTLAMAMMLPVV
jgi:hypothetical protein